MRYISALLALVVVTAAACSPGDGATTSSTTYLVVPTTVAVSDPVPAADAATLVVVHRVRSECATGVCRETLVWSDGHFRTSAYDQEGATAGQINPATVAAVIDAAASGQLTEESKADVICQPDPDRSADSFLVAVDAQEAGRRLSWCRSADADLPPAWDTINSLVTDIEATPTHPAADIVMRYSITGGCGMTGSCTTTSIDEAGRRWAVAPVPFDEGQVALVSSHTDPDDVDRLVALISETDFAALRASLGEGRCNGCVDGIDFSFEFAAVGVTLDSVTYDLSPANHPLFELMWEVAG